MVLLRLSAGAGGRDAPSRAGRRSLRAKEGDARLAGAVRGRIGGLCLLDVGGHLHRRPHAAGTCRGRRGRDGALGARGALQRGGAAEGGRHLGGCELSRAADRADPRRLAAEPLLVGLGVPDESARRGDRTCGGGHARAGVALIATAWSRRGRSGGFRRRLDRPDVWPDRGRRARVGRHPRTPGDGRRGGRAGRVLRLGASS